MKNLFLQEADFGTDAPVASVPSDKAQWDVFLQAEILKKFPNLYGHPVEVKLKDAGETGAFGAVLVKSGKNESKDIVFPVIIKDGKMFGFDVFSHSDKFSKATEDNINRALNEEALNLGAHKPNSQASGLDDRISDTSNMDLSIMDPGAVFSGKTVVAAAMCGSLYKKATIKNYLQDIAKVVPEVAGSLANKPMAKQAFIEFIHSANEMLARKIETRPEHFISKAASLSYNPKRYSYEAKYSFVDPSTSKIKVAEFRTGTLEEFKHKMLKLEFPEALVSKLAEDMKSSDEAIAECPCEAEIIGDDTLDLANNSSGMVFDSSGNPHKGVVIDKVVDFDLNVLPTKLFLCTESPGSYAFADSISLKSAPEASTDLSKLVTPVEQGATVSFIIQNPNKPNIATFPFKVLSVKNFNGHTAYVGKFVMRDEAVTLVPSQITSSIVPMKKEDMGEYGSLANTEKVYSVPENIKAVSLDSAIPLDTVKSGSAKYIFKQAGRRREKIAEVVRFGSTIKVKHPDFAEDLLGKMACASLGIGRLYDKLLKMAGQHKQVFVALPEYESTKITKISAKLSKPLKINKLDMIKAAAGINDENLSMLNLSLGLSDSSDGFKFSEYIELFKDAIDKLAKLLMASRLGMDMSDSSAIKISIDALDSIISQLRTL
jgi:hypothetical protein